MTHRPSASPDFQALFEGAPNLYLVLTPDLRIVAASDAYCRATVTVREQILGRGLFDVFPDNPTGTGVSNLRASLERVLSLRLPDPMALQKYDMPRPASEGGGFEERYWSPLNTPTLNDDGEIIWIIHRVEDVTEIMRLKENGAAGEEVLRERNAIIQQLQTANRNLAKQIDERKRAQEELARTRNFLDLVTENIPAMVFVKDAKNLRFVLINRAGEEMLGIGRSELIGKSDYDFFPKEQTDFFTSRDKEAMQSGGLHVIPEEPINTRHRGVRLLRTLKLPVPDEQGRPEFLLALCEDITERKNAEAALRESEARFRGFLAASPDAMIIIDQTSRILLASQRVQSMFGYAPEEVLGEPISVLLPERYGDIHAGHLHRYMKAPKARYMSAGKDLYALRKDGSEFPVEISLNPDRTSGNLVLIAAVRDITDRKTVEMQLRQAQKMEAIGNLTGGMAHDFNNLLSVVIGNLDLLRERQSFDPESGELAREALDAALRGADLTQRLLAFARRQALQSEPIKLNKLVARISKLLSRTLGENIEIKLDLEDNTWPVIADPAQLEASLVNIVNNARDSMPRGGVLMIATGNRHLDDDYASQHPGFAPGDYTLIEVSDTGTGMPRVVVDQIFEPFFTTKEQGKGTGLGLSMVFGFMKQSGGHINVYSEVGVGTTFRLYLPRALAGAEQPRRSR
jgi:PAS domain S-box-containing protein